MLLMLCVAGTWGSRSSRCRLSGQVARRLVTQEHSFPPSAVGSRRGCENGELAWSRRGAVSRSGLTHLRARSRLRQRYTVVTRCRKVHFGAPEQQVRGKQSPQQAVQVGRRFRTTEWCCGDIAEAYVGRCSAPFQCGAEVCRSIVRWIRSNRLRPSTGPPVSGPAPRRRVRGSVWKILQKFFSVGRTDPLRREQIDRRSTGAS